MARTYLLLGSNEGDRENLLENARFRISLLVGKSVTTSGLYETAPWGKEDQPSFLNQVMITETPLDPDLLLTTLLAIEKSLGRVRNEKWGPRTIDLDILFYGDQIVQKENLTIPHPAIAERRFTLVPLADIAPDFVHPVSMKTMKQMLDECGDQHEVKRAVK